MNDSTAARDRAIEADPVTEATVADLSIAADMHGPHELMGIPRVRVVELLDEIKRLRALATPDEDSEAYRMVADHVIKWLNPPDGDEAEVALLMGSIKRAAQFIEAQPCTCEEGAYAGDVDPCERCAALGRRADREVEW